VKTGILDIFKNNMEKQKTKIFTQTLQFSTKSNLFFIFVIRKQIIIIEV